MCVCSYAIVLYAIHSFQFILTITLHNVDINRLPINEIVSNFHYLVCTNTGVFFLYDNLIYVIHTDIISEDGLTPCVFANTSVIKQCENKINAFINMKGEDMC